MRASPLLLAAALFAPVHAESNIDPLHSLVSDDLIGALDFRPSSQDGAVISQYYCSGKIYGANVGWISLSSGAPANGLSFANNSAQDYGVNVSPTGAMSGYAYGANIGWINFAAAGQPRIDFITGKLSGAVWGANVGWIDLASSSQYIRLEALPELPDSDNDGLPDAYELQLAASLNALDGSADTDHDGATDLEEFRAGTNPRDPADFLSLRMTLTVSGNQVQFTTKPGYTYRIEQHPAFGSGIWSVAPLGDITGTGASAIVQLPPNAAHLFFYRVAAYPPLSAF